MIENYLLEALVTFAKEGTLAATAKQLRVTQPSITRAMQKLEDQLEVRLFDRKPNRIALTETGKLAAQEAEKILVVQEKFIESIRHFDRNHKEIRLASVAPGPLLILPRQNSFILAPQLIESSEVEKLLLSHEYNLIISEQDIETERIESVYIGSEDLRINIDPMTTSLQGDHVTFAQIDDLSFITLSDLGIWQNVINKEIPQAKFIPQASVENFREILNYSSFPFFSTNLARSRNPEQAQDNRRQELYITDEAAMIDFYISFLKENKAELEPMIEQVKNTWKEYEL